jgi:hypothetical protein
VVRLANPGGSRIFEKELSLNTESDTNMNTKPIKPIAETLEDLWIEVPPTVDEKRIRRNYLGSQQTKCAAASNVVLDALSPLRR